ARLAQRFVVLSGRRARHRRAVLRGSAAPLSPRAATDRRSRRRQRPLAHAAPAARGGARARHRVPAAPACGFPPRVRARLAALPPRLRRPPGEPRLRAAPALVVRAKPPDRGLRGNLRRLARAEAALAAGIRRLAGAREARARRPADERDRRHPALELGPHDDRAAAHEPPHAARALPAQATALRGRRVALGRGPSRTSPSACRRTGRTDARRARTGAAPAAPPGGLPSLRRRARAPRRGAAGGRARSRAADGPERGTATRGTARGFDS